jgi:outer membrane protein
MKTNIYSMKYLVCRVCLAAFVVMPYVTVGQSVGQSVWSLERCIEHALSHNLQIKMERINAEVREIDLHTSRNSWLPNLNASVGQSFNFGRGQDPRTNEWINNSNYGTSLGVSTGMPLFTGFRVVNEIKRNEYNVQAAQQSLKKAQEDIAVAVAQAFLNVLLYKEIGKIHTETMNFSFENVKKTEIMVNSGSVPLSQLYEIKSQYASDEARVISAENDITLGLLSLSQLLELTYVSAFDVETPQIDEELLALQNIPNVERIYNTALGIKPQILAAEFNLEGSKAALKMAESGHYPQLSLNAGISDGYTYRSGSENTAFFEQLKGVGEYVGLSLSIPIFNRFATQNSIKQARLGIVQQQLTLDNAHKTLYKEIQQAYHNALAAQKSYYAAQKSVAAARESFRYAQSRYQTGKSSVYEFSESKTTLTRSLSEEVQAKYNYVFAIKILDFYAGVPIVL